jgi:hypothetical protein
MQDFAATVPGKQRNFRCYKCKVQFLSFLVRRFKILRQMLKKERKQSVLHLAVGELQVTSCQWRGLGQRPNRRGSVLIT